MWCYSSVSTNYDCSLAHAAVLLQRQARSCRCWLLDLKVQARRGILQTVAADAHDAEFAGIIAQQRLQLMLMMLSLAGLCAACGVLYVEATTCGSAALVGARVFCG